MQQFKPSSLAPAHSPAGRAASPTPARDASSAGATAHGRYLWLMVGLLASVTIFEGYDVTIFHLCTPDIARTFHMSDLDVGAMASIVRLGEMMAFVVVMLADRVGRKPIVSYTVLFYTLFTLMTALSHVLRTFTGFQSLAQLFLSGEFAVATIIISEEFPDRWRGRGVAILNMTGLVGVIAGRPPLRARGRLALGMARDVFHRDSAPAARRVPAPQLARDGAFRRPQARASYRDFLLRRIARERCASVPGTRWSISRTSVAGRDAMELRDARWRSRGDFLQPLRDPRPPLDTQPGRQRRRPRIHHRHVRTRPRWLHARSRRAEAHDLRVIRGRRRRDHAALPDRGPYRDAHCDGRHGLRVPRCTHRDRDLFGGTVSHRDSRDVL